MRFVVSLFIGVIPLLAPSAEEHGKLVFEETFDSSSALDENWEFQHGPSHHILSSRWRENVSVEKGTLKLHARKENRGGQEWTAASLWTKEKFQYGYFECRYKYAAATGTNSSFWIMTRGNPAKGKFEIDINEGHFPNELNSNIHQWTGKHWDKSRSIKKRGLDLSAEFHVYALRWNQDELIWYFDGTEIRREENTIFHGAAPIWLSLAVISWAGPVTNEIDGTVMEVDYVRVYEEN